MGDAGSLRILLVEDNEVDARLTLRAFDEAGIGGCLEHVVDGEQALQRIRRDGAYADESAIDLILLDLNLPRVSGMEMLRELKGDDSHRVIPVIVLTSSMADEDVAEAYRAHAAAYVTKPVGSEGFVAVAESVRDFWVKTVTRAPR